MELSKLTASSTNKGVAQTKNIRLNEIKKSEGNITIDFSGDANHNNVLDQGEYFSCKNGNTETIYYSVQKGDTLANVVKKFNVTQEDVIKQNNLKTGKSGYPIIRDDGLLKIVKQNADNTQIAKANSPQKTQDSAVSNPKQTAIETKRNKTVLNTINNRINKNLKGYKFKVEIPQNSNYVEITLLNEKANPGLFGSKTPTFKTLKKALGLWTGAFSDKNSNNIYYLADITPKETRANMEDICGDPYKVSNDFDSWNLKPNRTFRIDIDKYLEHNLKNE